MKRIAKHPVVADYMERDMITVLPSDTLRDALALMTENHVTGLPVVDKFSRCIGLITSSDILNYERENDGGSDDDRIADVYDPESQQWEAVPLSAFGLEKFGNVPVSDVMTQELIWVACDTPLKDVARRMVEEQVHRVLVMDGASRLYGILSAYDFVRVAAEG
jgi:CBS domain-containing protein